MLNKNIPLVDALFESFQLSSHSFSAIECVRMRCLYHLKLWDYPGYGYNSIVLEHRCSRRAWELVEQIRLVP